MPLSGSAALAMWWDMAPEMREEFEDWHSHEHFRERLGVPGFLRATRWTDADGGEGIFQMYELQSHAVLASPDYLARLNAPSPWSIRMMPHHRHMIRSQCHVLASCGAHVAQFAITVRLSPAPGQEARLHDALLPLLAQLVDRSGCAGGHLLRHEAPAIAQTAEQKMRGSDRFADWIVVATGYRRAALQALRAHALGPQALQAAGAQPGSQSALYRLSLSATAGDLS